MAIQTNRYIHFSSQIAETESIAFIVFTEEFDLSALVGLSSASAWMGSRAMYWLQGKTGSQLDEKTVGTTIFSGGGDGGPIIVRMR